MFSWATEQIEKLSQSEAFEKLTNAVAPPPADAPSRFVYCCQKDDEQGAIQCLAEMPGVGTIVHQVRGQVPLHVACLHSMPNLIRHLMTQPGASIQVPDKAGNTPLHCAVMSSKQNALDVVKMVVTDYQAQVTAKNSHGQSPYDVASLNMVRQYLLPLQLQKETQEALDNGGRGLPPGIDLGGLKIQNHHLPPPPSGSNNYGPPNMGNNTIMYPPTPMGMNAPGAPSGQPPPYGTPSHTTTAGGPQANSAPTSGQYAQPTAAPTSGQQSAPSSGNREYARTGGSSAAIYKPKGRAYVQADGFHSSSSDKRLQEKYGHSAHGYGSAVPPPPSSGNTDYVRQHSAPPSMGTAGGPNPFAGGLAALGGANRPANRRYVAYGPVTETHPQQQATPPRSGNFYGGAATPSATTFNPGAAAPSAATPTTPYMPPPPYQQQPAQQANFSPPPNQPAPFVPSPAAANVFAQDYPPAQVDVNVHASPSGQDASALFSRSAGSAVDAFSAPSASNAPPTSIEVKVDPQANVHVAAAPVATETFASPPKAATTFHAPAPAEPSLQQTSSASDIFSRPAETAAANSSSAPVVSQALDSLSNKQVAVHAEAPTQHNANEIGDLRQAPLSTEANRSNTNVGESTSATTTADAFSAPPKGSATNESSPGTPTADVFTSPSAAAMDAPIDSLLGPSPAQMQPDNMAETSDGPATAKETNETSQNEVLVHHDEDGVGDLDDVPLSPAKPEAQGERDSLAAPAPLFEEIGMPPPPFSKK